VVFQGCGFSLAPASFQTVVVRVKNPHPSQNL
jgi:hypothetical protein